MSENDESHSNSVPLSTILGSSKVLLLNLGFFILSLVVEMSRGTPSWLEQFELTSTYKIQLGFLALSVLVALVTHEIIASRDLLHHEVNLLKKETRSFQEDLAKGIIEYQGTAYRSLRYDPTQGAIYYGDPVSANRNVLFNVETFQRILERAQAESADSEEEPNVRDTLLYKLGSAASRRFAQHFQEHVESKHISFELTSWLREWTSYDSEAGFGQMQVRDINAEHQASLVVVKYSFLTHGKTYGGDKSLCGFMIGYIEGLSKNFAHDLYQRNGLDQEGITVDHDFQADCYHYHQNPQKGCIFKVIAPKLTTDESKGGSPSKKGVTTA